MELMKSIVFFVSFTSILLSFFSPQAQSLDSSAALKAVIEASKNEFKNAIKEVNQFPKDQYASEFTGQCLDICRDNFKEALTTIKDAAEAMARNDVNGLQTMLTAIATSVTTCDDTFKERPEAGTPLEQINTKLRDLTQQSLAISAAIYNLKDGRQA